MCELGRGFLLILTEIAHIYFSLGLEYFHTTNRGWQRSPRRA